MTDRDLAQNLVLWNLLQPQQVEAATALVEPGRNLAQVVVELGWLDALQLLSLAPTVFKPPVVGRDVDLTGAPAQVRLDASSVLSRASALIGKKPNLWGVIIILHAVVE